MLLSQFITLAMEGYSVVVKEGILERIPEVPMKRVFSHVRKNTHNVEDNLRTLLAFIEAFKESHGLISAHLATLLLIEAIQKQEILSSEIMLTTYQNIVDIELVLKKDFNSFVNLPVSKQKEFIALMVSSPFSLTERTLMSKAFLLQNYFRKGQQEQEAYA